MTTTTRRRSLFCALFRLGLLLAASGATVAQDSDYYIVDGKRVPLVPSDEYEAVEVKPGERGPFTASVIRGGQVTIETSDFLDQYDVVLLRSKEGATRGAWRSSAPAAAVRSDVPVYELGGIDQVLVNEFVVQFNEDTSEQQAAAFLREQGARVVPPKTSAGVEKKRPPGRYVITFPTLKPRQALAAVNRFHGSGKVAFAEPNFLRVYPSRPQPPPAKPATPTPPPGAGTLTPAPAAPAVTRAAMTTTTTATPSPSAALRTPNDDLFSRQWALNNGGNPGVAGADIGALGAWGYNVGDDQITIAIIDDGVDVTHGDLAAKIVTPYDATDGDDDQQPNSWDGHGTACAGIASALTDNAVGVAGVSWKAKILPIRIAYSNWRGGPWITSNTIIEDGLRTAVDRGAKVLSNSWGGGAPSSAINSAIDYAIASKRVVVFAAGNDSGPVSYPADLSASRTMITVSATNEWDEFKTTASQDGEVWWGSNFGPQVTLAAPGVHIHTTDITGTDGYSPGDYNAGFNGTSSATPFVAGAAAVLLTLAPDSTPAQIRDLLTRNARDLGPAGYDERFGYGRLNLRRAVEELAGPRADHVALVIEGAARRLKRGHQAVARVTATAGGNPIEGVLVSFTSANPSRASVTPATALTNPQGIAEAQVRGEAGMFQMSSVDITAESGEQKASAPVKVPDLPLWTIAVLAGLMMLAIARRGG